MSTLWASSANRSEVSSARVEQACQRALECEAVDVGLIVRMVERAAETDPPAPQRTVIAAAGRFACDVSEFAVDREAAR